MSDARTPAYPSPEKTMVIVVHALNVASVAVGISALVALVLAYVKKGEAEPWAESHYIYAIRTFWIGLLYSVISIALMFVLIGFALIVAVAIWWLVRTIVALVKATREEEIANPRTWLV